MQIFLSKPKPFDVFFAEKQTEYGVRKHYYVCIYSQEQDENNHLNNDVYGLIVTTNPKYEYLPQDDYNVPIDIFNKKSYVCCDKLVRIRLDDKIDIKKYHIPNYKRKQITHKLQLFLKEMSRQIESEVK